ncbi:MAG: hypothetical protein LC116_03910 [Bacteroidetes bacterium]|nr:hypothetical protein [Bacteroidota bacterium]
MTNDLQFSTRKTVCPCGHGKDFVPLTSHPTGGKCWANHCGQKFFPPEQDPRPLPTLRREIFDNLPADAAERYERLCMERGGE